MDALVEHDDRLDVVVENEAPELGHRVRQRVGGGEETVRILVALCVRACDKNVTSRQND